MSINTAVVRATRAHRQAVARFNAASRRVARAGDQPYSDFRRSRSAASLDRAERESLQAGQSVVRTASEVLEALGALATANGLSIGPEALAVRVGSTLWTVHVPLGSERPEVTPIRLARVVGL
jgi:hypothetical protein